MTDGTEQTDASTGEEGRRQDPPARRLTLEKHATRGEPKDIACLVESLNDENPGVQQAAILGLVQIGGVRVFTRMLDLLGESPQIRTMAMEVIEQVLPEAFDAVPAALDSADTRTRKAIADALGKQTDTRYVSLLRTLLSDVHANVRAAAAEALGHLHAQDAVPDLMGLLEDEEWVAFAAVGALADIGDPSALPALTALARCGSNPVRSAAIEALSALDQDGTSLPLLIELAATADPYLRPALIKAFAGIADGTGADVWSQLDKAQWFTFLAEAVTAQDPTVRLAAIKGLGSIGDKRAARLVLNAYQDLEQPTEEETEASVLALLGSGNVSELVAALPAGDERLVLVATRALGILRAREAVTALGVLCLTHQNWENRRAALTALFMIGSEKAKRFVKRALDDPTGYVRCEAVRLLATSKRDVNVRTLLTHLRTERYADVREEIVRALARAATKDIWPEIIDLSQTGRPEARAAAAQAIGLATLPEGLDPLICGMNDPDWQVRRAAVEALGRYDDDHAFHSLVLGLEDDHDKVRLAATIAVSRWERPEAIEALLSQSLHDSDIWVRYRAVERFGARHVREAVEPLIAIASSEREPALLRRAAIVALGAIGASNAVPTLNSLAQHDNADLRLAATQALDTCMTSVSP